MSTARRLRVARPAHPWPMLLTLVLGGLVASVRADAGGDVHAAPPLKVFILAGQSNMQGHAHVRTLDAMALDPDTAALLARIRADDGSLRVVPEVRVSSLGSAPEERVGPLGVGFGAGADGSKFGPELTFGLIMHEQLGEPILLIKTAWGGRSLHTDFRPPGAVTAADGGDGDSASDDDEGEGEGEGAKSAAGSTAGASYQSMIEHVRFVLGDLERVVPGHDPARGHELAGFVWFQGWNDMVDRRAYPARDQPGGYDQYASLLAQLIRDVRRDLDAPALPFVIGVMGVGGPVDDYGPEQQRYAGIHRRFRRAQADPASQDEFAGTVAAVATAPSWDQEVTALRARERALAPRLEAIRARVASGELDEAAGREAIEAVEAEAFTERERTLLRESTSNAEFHYLGSARIMGRIGAAFAEAMLELTGRAAPAGHDPDPGDRR